MTFYEAALRVLEEAGAPLHSLDITKRAIDRGLLSHIGKTPEVTMLSRLAAMARRPRDRKILVTARDTFGLTDWLLPEDAEALTATGIVEPNPEEDLPPYRPLERHPEARAEYLRAIGRQAERERKRRGEDEGKRRKYPPVPEVAFELLQECQTALAPAELCARLKAGDLSDELSVPQLLAALADDNQRRTDQGRRPNFAAARNEAGELQLSVEPGAEGGPQPLELQQAFCQAVGLPFENGRVVLKGQRPAPRAEGAVAPAPEDLTLVQQAKHAVKDAKKAMARVLRRTLGELDLGTFEKACVRMLHGLHFRELKLARRSKDGPTLTARRKDGSLELRFAVRLLKGGQPIERRHIQDLRRDLSHHGAAVGLVLSAGEARGDARAEALGGGGLVMLWCGDALAEKFFEAHVGVTVTTVELYAIQGEFFEQARLDAEETQRRREERQREKAMSGAGADAVVEAGERVSAEGPSPSSERAGSPDEPRARDEEGGEEGEGDEGPDDEGPEGPEAGASDALGGSEGRKRRRRRRRRRRGGARPEGQPGAPQEVLAAQQMPTETAAPVPPPPDADADAALVPPTPREPGAGTPPAE